METLTSLLTAIPITIGGIFITWMGWRGGQGKLERNALMGVRNPTTLQSDAAWEAAHRAVAKPTMIGGIGAAISGVVAGFLPGDINYIAVLVGVGWMLAWVTGSLGTATRAAEKAAAAEA
ncbi:SdpI family protein [Mycetocola lacteus]|uniref:SdpI family protein n=1 Tax=Mycetocola lacteus TaxID=76637 RepID=A0A3L7AWZ6_9MICO|nr:SdpI family protein [Mycetocola lacteus]RLP84088.1 SdpI family protein [Mycetocola lacteus]